MFRGLGRAGLILVFLGLAPRAAYPQGPAQAPPNIVLIFPDNPGWGEVGVYGGVRGVPTPSIDRMAEEGIRRNNFKVEYSCTVSRVALLTGRYATRTGGTRATGMTLGEVPLAEALQEQGTAAGLFGKWRVGGDNWEGSREPTDQGVDEWFGIPCTGHTAQFTSFEPFDPETMAVPYIWECRVGETPTRLKPCDVDTCRTLDRRQGSRRDGTDGTGHRRGEPAGPLHTPAHQEAEP